MILGMMAKTAIAPVERVKMTFQVSSERFSLRAAYLCMKDLYKLNGFLSLWKGHSTNIIRIAPYAGFSYAIHDFAEKSFKKYLEV